MARTEKKEKSGKKLEFSQKMCKASWWLMAATVFICLLGEFVLQWMNKGSMGEVVTVVLSLISFVTVFINGGYITQNVFRSTSLNKHGMRIPEGGGKHYMPTPYEAHSKEELIIEDSDRPISQQQDDE